jgi:hypothetical protein
MPETSVIPGPDAEHGGLSGPAGAGTPDVPVEPEETEEEGGSLASAERPGHDWESRFKGLQGRLQREIEEKRALQQQILQLQEQMLRQRLQDLDPEEQEVALKEFRLQQREQELAQLYWQMEMAARQFALMELSQKYGVPVEELEQFQDGYSMEAYARGVAEARKRLRREQRRAQQQDRFEQATAPAVQRPAARNLDEAEMSWREFVRTRLSR